ncbi:MAG: hypothetical protein H6772_00140 [Pseudomonadales bacterium]|nr:hypothetical protein [Pseudomonadales bacterium]
MSNQRNIENLLRFVPLPGEIEFAVIPTNGAYEWVPGEDNRGGSFVPNPSLLLDAEKKYGITLRTKS